MRPSRSTGAAMAIALAIGGTAVDTAGAQTPPNAVFLQSFLTPSTLSSLSAFVWGNTSASDAQSFDLFRFDGTNLIGPSLFNVAFPNPTIGVTSFDVFMNLNPIALPPSTLFAIVLSTTGGVSVNTDHAVTNGDLFLFDGSSWADLGVDDMGFSTTFVPTPVTSTTPEPGSLLLLATGASAMLGVARTRRRS